VNGIREFPVFLPAQGEHLAAVVTTPEEPRGLVLLLTGLGAPRSHRFQTWTRLARKLAHAGLASVRVDHQGGTGDSTGDVTDWSYETGMHIKRQYLEVVRTSTRLLRVDRVAFLGNCMGAEVSLYLASHVPNSVGAFAIHLQTRDEWVGAVRKIRHSRIAAFVRSDRRLRRWFLPRLRGYQGKAKPYLKGYLAGGLRTGRVVLLFDDQDRSYNSQIGRRFQRMVSRLPADQRARFRLQTVHDAKIPGFETLESQELVIDMALEWAAACFGRAIRPETASSPSGPAGTT
jgi:pimeloyl-ACP methyl ester carboxylesterase